MRKFFTIVMMSLLLVVSGCAKKTCTVTFNSIGGTVVEPITLNVNEAIELKPVAERYGYAFVGWYEDVWYIHEAVFPYYVEADVTLYAKWVEAVSEDEFTFQLKTNGEYEVMNYTGKATSLPIPATYKGIAVTSIGTSAFSFRDDITSVVIPEGIVSIGDWAFADCDGLKTVTLPDTLKSVGAYAFYDCNIIEDVALSDAVTLGEGAFSGRDYPGCHCKNKYSK